MLWQMDGFPIKSYACTYICDAVLAMRVTLIPPVSHSSLLPLPISLLAQVDEVKSFTVAVSVVARPSSVGVVEVLGLAGFMLRRVGGVAGPINAAVVRVGDLS